ncbi:MAG: LLM class F420-dependent oxidoreductase [Rhodococcus qingshengii]
MLIDGNIGGAIDGTAGADFAELSRQVDAAQRIGYNGVWSTEVSRDPFLPLLLAAEQAPNLEIGTAIAVAFARSPMTLAATANDLHAFSSGRFMLGLGSQIKPHIERRFSMPWSSPAARMHEFVRAVRAIWQCWQDETPLDFQGEFYQHTLMTPMFRPGPNAFGTPRILIAAVGPHMTETAAEVADGILVHGFTTERYLREATVPQIKSALDKAGKEWDNFTLSYPGLVVTGADDREFREATAAVRKQIAFYGSTPAYRGVLELHGWDDLHLELNRLSKQGDWTTMSELIDDEILNVFAVVGEPSVVAQEAHRRFGDVIDRFGIYTPYTLAHETTAELVTALRSADVH